MAPVYALGAMPLSRGRSGTASGEVTSFPQAVQLKEDEVIALAWVVFASKADRDRINKAVMARPAAQGVDGSLEDAVRRQAHVLGWLPVDHRPRRRLLRAYELHRLPAGNLTFAWCTGRMSSAGSSDATRRAQLLCLPALTG
jgi:uncharacterized protein DUF1428